MKDVEDKADLVERFFSGTGSTYDLVVNLATFGIDHRWKRTIVGSIPTNSRQILDLACGTGILTLAIARRHRDCHVVGVELRDEYLQIARQKMKRDGIENVEFVLSRAEDYRSRKPFDCILSSYLAKYADLDSLTRNTRGMLREEGLVLMHDFTFPPRAFLVCIWRVYFKLLQLIGIPILPSWREIFHGLPRLIEQTRWPSELDVALRKYRFKDIQFRYLTAYGSAIMTARK